MQNNADSSPWRRLIATAKVMSIAAADAGQVWSAPVYYLFSDDRFYFFSNPKAWHIRMAENGLSAASIFQDDADFTNLAGIQMSGTILKAPLNTTSMAVAKNYCSRFKISATGDLLGFFASKFHAGLYCFEPDIAYYMDNRKGFGSREIVEL